MNKTLLVYFSFTKFKNKILFNFAFKYLRDFDFIEYVNILVLLRLREAKARNGL